MNILKYIGRQDTCMMRSNVSNIIRKPRSPCSISIYNHGSPASLHIIRDSKSSAYLDVIRNPELSSTSPHMTRIHD